jgi:hypothetical protein
MQLRHLLAIAAAIAAALGVALLPAAASASTGWHVVPTPNPSGSASNFLTGVSCTSATNCTAVGGYAPGSQFLPLIEHWNGTSWKIQSAPLPSGGQDSVLEGVKCVSATFCVAVGNYHNSAGTGVALAEFWNGTRWKSQSAPGLGFLSVACTTTTNCVTTGQSSAGYSQIEHWNGASWQAQPTPATGVLYGVSCTAKSACTAVGQTDPVNGFQNVLAERWNGTTWTIQSTPSGPGVSALLAVKCASSTACMAVGVSNQTAAPQTTLIERWNGTSWQLSGQSLSGGLTGVFCTTASACTAVGGNGTALAERWNGTSWTSQATPNLPDTSLQSVSCTSASACMAVGQYNGVTLAEQEP